MNDMTQTERWYAYGDENGDGPWNDDYPPDDEIESGDEDGEMDYKESAQKYTIYALVDPRNGEVRYIGRTATPVGRRRAHQRLSRIDKLGIDYREWRLELAALHLVPEFHVLEVVDRDVKNAEVRWICWHLAQGSHLTNMMFNRGRWIRASYVAQLLGLSDSTIRRWMKVGKIAYRLAGEKDAGFHGRYLIDAGEVSRILFDR
jgi:Helix-turn-helix domain